MTDHELERLLSLTEPGELRRLYDDAYQMKLKYIGKKVSIRGLIEISNICRKNCYYCGIRSGNRNVKRFQISREEIIETALWAYRHRFASLVLQSGEMMSDEFTEFIESIVREICAKTDHQAGITLSLGEQSPETYRRWREAGATRYLLRIEASDPELYAKLHPADHSYEARVACLRSLRELDYQVGTGVMIGLPGQTVKHLVKDLRFFQEHDIDMIGMGPYIPHEDTPLGAGMTLADEYRKHQLELGLKMIACARLLLEDVNIASTTALQALDPMLRLRADGSTGEYQKEPYALCGDVYSLKGYEGRGGWSLYTGAAGWLLSTLYAYGIPGETDPIFSDSALLEAANDDKDQ